MPKLHHLCLSVFVLLLFLGIAILPAASASARMADAYAAKVKTSDGYAPLRAKAVKSGSVRVIVGVDASFTPEPRLDDGAAAVQRSAIAGVQDRLLKSLANTGKGPLESYKYKYTPYVFMKVNAATLDALLASDATMTVHEDIPGFFQLDKSVPIVGANILQDANIKGAGYTVAVVDSGVAKNHPFLKGSVVDEACYSTNDASIYASSVCAGGASWSTDDNSAVPNARCPAKYCGHGTHVAGIVAGRDVGGQAPGPGVAPEATIIALQTATRIINAAACASGGMTSPCVQSYPSDWMRALARVYELRSTYNIAAVNMSVGTERTFSSACDTDPVKTSIDLLLAAGIPTVVSSGNTSTCGAMGSPACISSAVSVGATTSTATSDTPANYSNRASFMTLWAPGTAINSSWPPNTYESKGGTSMAAPHVAGAFALLKSARPTATAAEMIAALSSTGTLVNDPGCASVSKRRINVNEAKAALDNKKLLTVEKAGPGRGTVTSSPAGVNCGGQCTFFFDNGAPVTLSAAPNTGNSFTGWSGGGCSGTGTCTVTMASAATVTATFGSSCSYTVSPTHTAVSYKGRTVDVTVMGSGTGACGAPSVTTNESWIETSLVSFANNRGTVRLVIRPNDVWTPRTGMVYIAGKAFTVNQKQTSCSPPKLSPGRVNMSSAGGSSTFTVDVNGECGWTTNVDFMGAGWITVNAGQSGSGEGPVNFTVAPNTTGRARSGYIYVYRTGSSDWRMFIVKQDK